MQRSPMAESFNPKTQTYTSPRPPIKLPTNPEISLPSFIFESTSSIPHNVALIDSSNSNETLTFLQLEAHVSSLAYALHRHFHISKDDVVLILAPNSIRFPVSFLAIVSLGAVATTANPSFTVDEISKQVKDCNPKLIVTIPELYNKVNQFNVPLIFLQSSSSADFSPNTESSYYSDIMKNYAQHPSFRPPYEVKQNDVAALMYSSGTTGTAKGVVLTHRNFIASTLNFVADQDLHDEGGSVGLCFVPMFHAYGSVLTFAQLRRGDVLVSMAKFELDRVLGAVEKYRVTHLFVVPPVMVSLAKQRAVKKQYHDLSSLRQIFSSAAPLSRDLIETCAKNFPHVEIVQVRTYKIICAGY